MAHWVQSHIPDMIQSKKDLTRSCSLTFVSLDGFCRLLLLLFWLISFFATKPFNECTHISTPLRFHQIERFEPIRNLLQSILQTIRKITFRSILGACWRGLPLKTVWGKRLFLSSSGFNQTMVLWSVQLCCTGIRAFAHYGNSGAEIEFEIF